MVVWNTEHSEYNMSKYVDDATVVVRQHTDTDINDERNNIMVCATASKLTLNLPKSEEMCLNDSEGCIFPYTFQRGIKLIGLIAFLAYFFRVTFKMDSHAHYILSQCTKRMYILKLLQHQTCLQISLMLVYAL